MQIIDLEQGTPEWLAWRSGGLGGSDAPVIMGCSPYGTAQSLWEEKRGLRQRPPTNPGQLRGHELEPLARQALEQHLDMSLEPACAQHDTIPCLRASFDALSFSGDVMGECKAPNVRDHAMALAGRVPAKYVPQVQHLYQVNDLAERAYYVSYRPNEPVAILPVMRDEVYIAKLQAAELRFWEAVVSGQLPQNVALRSAALAYRLLQEEIEALQAFDHAIRAELVSHIPEGGKRVQAEGLLISLRSVPGELDLDRIRSTFNVDKAVINGCRRLGAIDDAKAIKAFGKEAVDNVRRRGAVEDATLALTLSTTLDELDQYRAAAQVTVAIKVQDDATPSADLMETDVAPLPADATDDVSIF